MSLYAPWSLRSLAADLQSGRATPADALARSADRIAETERVVQAWVERGDEPGAGLPGRLAGVPLGVKDIIDVVGYPTRCGSVLRADAAPAAKNAAIVEAWTATGAVVVGKTVTTEFAFFAPGPTRNPVDPDRTPGGSSSGSAAAVAAGHVPLALGSQTAGSVTRPASYCGVASLVMTQGRYPNDGVVGLSESLDSHGVYAATVSDLALAWSALTGDPDVGIADSPPPRLLAWTAAPLDVVTSEMRGLLIATAERLRALGATVDPFPFEDLIAEVTAEHPVEMAYEACRERAYELGHADQLSEPLRHLLHTGVATSDASYARAQAVISDARTRVGAALVGYDAILGPAAPGVAPAGLDATGDPVLSRAWQAMGFPTVCVPGLRSVAGLPLGLQLVGRANDEIGALAAGCWIEQRLRRGR